MAFTEAARWGECCQEAGLDQRPAVCARVSTGCYTAEGAGDIPSLSDFEDAYQGQWGSFRDYAEQPADDIGLTDGWPEEAERYFDWGAWTHNLRFDYAVPDAPPTEGCPCSATSELA
ncbi:antirestriction protein ArdA [Gulosibacter bifidus]|uniref:Antirestriction protein ArdA n=1 Tax=Gulosibacter bifidus TaxID=272239 RepID=A0ABW5RI26_9MICO|nr:antirestriction protein ArdA [Gulosibacter bifidus]